VSSEDLPDGIEGAMLVIWSGNGMALNTSKIEAVDGRTITLERSIDHPDWPGHIRPTHGNPFYITDSLALLDAPGEYWYNQYTGQFYFYAPNGQDPTGLNLTVKTDTHSNSVFLKGRNYVTIDGFDIYGGDIYTEDSSHITIQNCSIRYTRFYNPHSNDMFIHTSFGLESNMILRNCEIGPSAAGIGIYGDNNLVTDNIFHSVGYAGAANPVIAMTASRGNEISHNTVYDAGGGFIEMPGWGGGDYSENIIRNNHIINPMALTVGGAVIGTHETDGGGTLIHDNLIELGEREFELEHLELYIEGILIGDYTANYTVRDNILIGAFTAALSAGHSSRNVDFIDNIILDEQEDDFDMSAYGATWEIGSVPEPDEVIIPDYVDLNVEPTPTPTPEPEPADDQRSSLLGNDMLLWIIIGGSGLAVVIVMIIVIAVVKRKR
jgi:hypothetical protein